MQSLRSCAFWTLLLSPAALFAADVDSGGTIAVSGGGAFLEGDRPAFQRITQLNKDGFGGVEEYRLTRESKESLFRFDARLMPGNDMYLLHGRFEVPDKYYVDAGFQQFRVFYDGSGGYFRPTGTEFTLFDEDLSLTRTTLWAEAGYYTGDKTLFRFRYERRMRDGTKDSTSWGDTNLVGTYGTRSIVPSFYDLDESTDVFTFDIGNDQKEETKWGVGARYSETKLDNKRNMHRRPHEAADRIVTQKDQTTNDLFAVNGFYLRQLNEKLTVSAGALRTKLDTKLAGSRIYGGTYDPVFDPAFSRRQQRDEGFIDLQGDTQLKQTVLNLNAVYTPKKNWSVRPSIRYENLHQEAISEFEETNVGAGPAFPTIVEGVEAEHKKEFDEFTEAVEGRYTGMPNWTFSAKGEWIQGNGNLEEERVLHTGVATIDRDTDYDRMMQKYSFTSNWYVNPGLTLAMQYYFKNNTNEYDAIRDNTPPGTADRYPAYITDQDFRTHDFNIRLSWRPVSLLGLVTRYDHQQSKITSNEAGLATTESSRAVSHIISQSVTYSPTSRLYLTGSVNVTYDQIKTPAIAFVQHADNNYINGSLGGGYAVGKLDDLYLDYSFFTADNYIDASQTTLPYGLDQKLHAAYLTWVRRQSEHLVFTFKYGYVTNRDGTWVGRNDFDAHVLYAKVQYHF
jgi:hypothetical protein